MSCFVIGFKSKDYFKKANQFAGYIIDSVASVDEKVQLARGVILDVWGKYVLEIDTYELDGKWQDVRFNKKYVFGIGSYFGERESTVLRDSGILAKLIDFDKNIMEDTESSMEYMTKQMHLNNHPLVDYDM